MTETYLLAEAERPAWLSYPASFRRVVEQGLLDLSPWYIIDGRRALERMKGLSSRYPHRELVPFALRGDNDDVACFERGRGEAVSIVHDFASPGYEARMSLPSFWDWFRYAVEEMIMFEP